MARNGFGALAETELPAGKTCSVCGKTKGEAEFSKKQYAAKAHSRKCTSCASPAGPNGNNGSAGPEEGAAGGLHRTVSKQQAPPGPPDLMTLQEVALHLAAARAKYQQNTDLPDEAVCRLMLMTRMAGLPLNRCRVDKSSLPGAGNGLFATRLINAGELISLYPTDALLVWEDASHSVESNIQIFFSKHIPPADRNVARTVTEWRGYEVPCNELVSIVGDPQLCHDLAYAAHLANDGAICSTPEGREEYERESAARANAEFIPLEVEEVDTNGFPMVLHFAARATKPIQPHQEILVTYGVGYWELNAAGLFNFPASS